MFFDKFADLEVKREREERFQKEAITVYKRCAKTESVSSQLVDHMKGISMHLNKEFVKMKMTRRQKEALTEHGKSLDVRNSLGQSRLINNLKKAIEQTEKSPSNEDLDRFLLGD